MALSFDEPERSAAKRLCKLALVEDLGGVGDLTTAAITGERDLGTVQIVARTAGVLAGLPIVGIVFRELGGGVACKTLVEDGAGLSKGTVVAELTGALWSLLSGERTALNFLTHLSGIASLTRQYADAIAGTCAGIYDTRKTLPGWRILEKYAVRAGGGRNHRIGLFDMVLIKDNHLAGWVASHPGASIADAIRTARERIPAGTPVEVEVDRLDQFADALLGHPDIILLDNMPCSLLREAVAMRNNLAPGVELEASGGVSLATVADIAHTGVERISAGALTHSAPALDLAFDWKV